jgi:arginase family enzyme
MTTVIAEMRVQTEEWRERRIDFDDRAETYHVACDGAELVSTNVVLSVAALEGVRPTELDPLAMTVDPDALDDLFAPGTEVRGRVSFTYEGYDVTVRSDGRLEVVPADEVALRQCRN